MTIFVRSIKDRFDIIINIYTVIIFIYMAELGYQERYTTLVQVQCKVSAVVAFSPVSYLRTQLSL